MNANNGQHPQTPPPQQPPTTTTTMSGPSATATVPAASVPTTTTASTSAIQIDMPMPATATQGSNSDSFGALRGRLMDGIRRVILPPSSSGGLVSSSSSHSNASSAYTVFRSESEQQPPAPPIATILAHHRSSLGGSTFVNMGSSSPQPQHLQREHSRTSPLGSPTSAPSYYQEAPLPQGGLQDEDLPPRTTDNNPSNNGGVGGGGGLDDSQRNVETFTDAMAQHPELRAFVVAVLKTLPFVGIIVLKLSYDHLHSLLNLAILAGIFLQTNHHLKKEIGKKQQKSGKKLVLLLLLISFGLFMKWVEDPFVLDILSMMSYRTMHTFPELLYYLMIADLSVKCLTVAAKIILTLMPEKMIEFKGRGRIYLLVEAISQFYRCFLPVQPWAAYLLNNYEGYDKIFGTLLVVAYVFWKFQEVLNSGRFLRESYIKFRQNSNFGTTPSEAEMQAVGNQCPICHESFSCPIALECGHIFCDLCIGVWFDRETTCPLCRKKITDDPRYRDGSTSLFLQVA